ncbi:MULTISPECIES: ABC transporter permease [Streptomyces]|uniref:Transport permease protein n=3 Tax=Streptomyces TaxID=1883 RepID=A0A101PUB0_STRCK|nr:MULTISPECIES: ABC transporter permease [Streptomyces]AEY88443.1 ABC-transporter transmembrane protein [Streptomyces hygroscopicus subsp. jinggangensis 5008]AGF62599.1 ABC-transporter transmembrane protein [Streptomyces hygroscopicus subsp. jinggangensis TL01]KUN17852.1 multidrug ABC transporter permease [Streptomyces corchorusii]GGY75683.1 transport permease protein [Streptomyces olivaceoviridis]GHA06421.1 transport permease protein [Streptomyces canarius]
MSALAYDGLAMAGRQLRRVRNTPGLAILTQLMPVNMLLFFGYVFGSALAVPGREYRSFLVPGLLAATAAGGLMTGMFQAAQDTHRGVMDRFRTMPVSRAAVPLGQAVADLLVTAVGTVPLLLTGLAVGWRIEGSAAGAAGAVGLLLLFRFACTCAGILLGLLSRSEEAAGQLGAASFVLPLLSNAYIPTGNLPHWLRVLAEWNPISAVTTALRDLFGNAPVPAGAAWPVAHPVAGSLAWSLALTALFLPLAVRRYARTE